MCQHNLPCSIVLPTACFPEGPSPHFTLCSFWRRRPRLEAVYYVFVLHILFKKGISENQHIHLKMHDRDPNSIPHSKHRAAWAYIIFMSFLHWDLKNLIALSKNLFIEKSLAVIQTYNRFFKSGSFTGKTFCYITFSKAEKIML